MIKISKISIIKTFEIPIITKLAYYSISSSSNRIYIFKILAQQTQLQHNIPILYFHRSPSLVVNYPLSQIIQSTQYFVHLSPL